MEVDEEKKKKIVRLIKTSAKRDEQPKPKAGTATALGQGNIQIGGNAGTTIVYNGPVFVGTEPPAAQDKPKTGLNNHQAAQLHKLKDEIVSLETEPDKTEATKNVWRSLNHKMQVETMRDIPPEKFAHARNYLGAWLKRLKAEGEQDRITELRAEIIADLDTEALASKVSSYIASHWPGQSLETLDTEDKLARVARYLGALSR